MLFTNTLASQVTPNQMIECKWRSECGCVSGLF